MEITFEQVGLILQIAGVLVVFLSQVKFGYKTRRKCGSIRKGFYGMISVVRVGGGLPSKEQSEKYLKETFPEWWELSGYLSTDIRDSAIGLGVTLVGLLIELSTLIIL